MKATHSGHCQLCGHLQKLPSGTLAKHGYTVKYGFFSGTCRGSHALPFEKGYDLVNAAIDAATDQLDAVQGTQAKWRTPATEPVAMVRNYERDARGRSAYHWRKVEIKSVDRVIRAGLPDEYRYAEIGYDAPGYKAAKPGTLEFHDLRVYDRDKGVLDIATGLNAKYADWLEHEADSLRRYIAWQTERVRTWKEAPLVPVDAKDKAGFVPTKPAY